MGIYGNTEVGGSTTLPAPGSTTSRSPAYPSPAQEAEQDAALNPPTADPGFAGFDTVSFYDPNSVRVPLVIDREASWLTVNGDGTFEFTDTGVYVWQGQLYVEAADSNGPVAANYLKAGLDFFSTVPGCANDVSFDLSCIMGPNVAWDSFFAVTFVVTDGPCSRIPGFANFRRWAIVDTEQEMYGYLNGSPSEAMVMGVTSMTFTRVASIGSA